MDRMVNSEWTLNTLQIHLEALINTNENLSVQRHNGEHNAVSLALENQRAMAQQSIAASSEAIRKAELAMEKRFDSVNEFRAQLGDQARTFMPRSEFEVAQNALMERLVKIEGAIAAQASTKTGATAGWMFAVGVVGFVMIITSIIVTITGVFRNMN